MEKQYEREQERVRQGERERAEEETTDKNFFWNKASLLPTLRPEVWGSVGYHSGKFKGWEYCGGLNNYVGKPLGCSIFSLLAAID